LSNQIKGTEPEGFTSWVQLQTACHSPAVHPVQNEDKFIENEYYIKPIFIFADGRWPWWHRSCIIDIVWLTHG